jgi:hypothetical protein
LDEVGGIAADDRSPSGGTVTDRQGDVVVGDVRPAWLVFDADRVAVEVGGFDKGGADAAHRVEDQVAGPAVGGNRVRGDRRQHPRRMPHRLGHVAAAALSRAGALGSRPHRQPLGRQPIAGPTRVSHRHGRVW